MENWHQFLFFKGKEVSESLVQYQKHFPKSTLEDLGKKKKLMYACKSNWTKWSHSTQSHSITSYKKKVGVYTASCSPQVLNKCCGQEWEVGRIKDKVLSLNPTPIPTKTKEFLHSKYFKDFNYWICWIMGNDRQKWTWLYHDHQSKHRCFSEA